jgi:Tol biopolymer transport system component
MVLLTPKTNYPDIWLRDLARGSTSRVTSGPMINASPVWSPDGAKLIFRTNRKGLIEFYQKSAFGGGNEEAVLPLEAQLAAGTQSVNLVPTDWSPDGRNIVYSVSEVASGYALWLFPLAANAKPLRLLGSSSDNLHANFSPNGRLVAYSSNESGRFQVYVQTFPLSERKWPVSTNGGYEPRWRGDGGEIYYLSEDRKLMAVSVSAGPKFGVPKALFQTRVPEGVEAFRTHYVTTRDGRRFLVNTQTGDPAPNPITVVLNWTAEVKR